MADETYSQEELEETTDAIWDYIEESGNVQFDDEENMLDEDLWNETAEKIAKIILETSYALHNKRKGKSHGD